MTFKQSGKDSFGMSLFAESMDEVSSEKGVAIIFALWILTVLVMVVTTFALTAQYRLSTSDDTVKTAQAEELSVAGIETLLGQIREDALLDGSGAAPADVIPTEIMNQNTTGKIKINEMKVAPLNDYTCDVNPGVHVELVNVGSGPVNITGWFGALEDAGDSMGPTVKVDDTTYNQSFPIGAETNQQVYLCPLFSDQNCTNQGPNYHRFFAIGTQNGGGSSTGGAAKKIKICTENLTVSQCRSASLTDPDVVDYARAPFSCTGSPWPSQCGLTWQVFPDGSHGQKPSESRDLTDAPTNWSKTACSMDATTLGDSSHSDDNADTVQRRHNGVYGFPDGDAVTEYNGRGIWLKRGNGEYEGLKFTHYDGSGDHNTLNFGSDIRFSDLSDSDMFNNEWGFMSGSNFCSEIEPDCPVNNSNYGNHSACQKSCNFKEHFYVDMTNSKGTALLTEGLTWDDVEDVYPNADVTYQDRNGKTHHIPVIPTGILNHHGRLPDTAVFPEFKTDQDRFLKVQKPDPIDQPLGLPIIPWNEYAYADRNLGLSDSLNDAQQITGAPVSSGDHAWLIRTKPTENPTVGLRRSDSAVASPDPGTYSPGNYSGSPNDYHFNQQTYADSEIHISESYDTQYADPDNDVVRDGCNLKITFLRKDEDRGWGAGPSPNYLEIFNPGPTADTLAQVKEHFHPKGNAPSNFDTATRYPKGGGTAETRLEPGEYFVIAQKDPKDPSNFPNAIPDDYVDVVNSSIVYDDSDDDDLGWKIIDDAGKVCDTVGIDQGSGDVIGSDWYEGSVYDYTNDVVLWRKKSSKVGEELPQDTDNNANDFNEFGPDAGGWHSVKDLKWGRADNTGKGFANYDYLSRSYGETILFEGPKLTQLIGGDYIEIYNMGDTVDPLGGTIRIDDSKDSDGDNVSGGPGPYDLRLHWLDPYVSGAPGGGTGGGVDGTLKPGQVALILEPDPDINARAIGWRPEGIKSFLQGRDINKDGRGDTIRIYTAGPSDTEFLTGGLYDEEMETIDFQTATTQTVLSSGSWDSDCALANRSCFKVNIEGENSDENWNYLSRLEGTPGRIHRVDHFDKIWGWGGSITIDGSSVDLDEPICVPSMTNCSDPIADKKIGDVGYFEIRRIEDVGGKINLMSPPASEESLYRESLQIGQGNETIDDPDIEGRSFLGAYGYPSSYDPTGAAIALPNTSFKVMSPDQMLRLEGVVSKDYTYGSNALDEYEHVYTTMRPDTDSRRINVNTAPYEALKAIQINPSNVDPTFMTQTMVEEIIDRRHCGGYTSGDTIPAENYDCGPTPGPFPTIERLCAYLDGNAAVSEDFDCEVIHDNAKVRGEGLIRAVVEGGVFGSGQIEGRARMEVMIDRRGINRPGRNMRIIFQRRL